MRNQLLILALGALALAACHTTEANYRAAYDVAKARSAEPRQESQLDPEVQAQLDRAAKRRQTVYIVGKDTLTVTSRFVSRVDTAGAQLPEFSIAVHGFEQRFNALAMMKRLRENGFPQAYVIKNSDPTYYVISAGTDSVGAVPALMRETESGAAQLGLAKGYPIVLRNPDRRK